MTFDLVSGLHMQIQTWHPPLWLCTHAKYYVKSGLTNVLKNANKTKNMHLFFDSDCQLTGTLFVSYTQKFSQYLCFLIKSTILHISLSNFIHELYYRNFTCTSFLRDKQSLDQAVSTKLQNARCARAAVNRQGYFRIYCSILKESCSYCNNPEKIQC